MNLLHKRIAHLSGALLLLTLLLGALIVDSSRSSGRPFQASAMVQSAQSGDYPIAQPDGAIGPFPAKSGSGPSLHPRPRGAFLLGEQVQAPDGPVAEVLRQLTPLALDGDANAALKLYMKLSGCELALHHPSAPVRLSGFMTAEEVAALETNQRAAQQDCATAVDEIKARGKWLEQAAASGDLQAQLLYSMDAEAVLGDRGEIMKDPDSVRRYRDRATGYLKSLSSSGSIDAMVQLSTAYERGVLIDRSDVLALAYLQAASLSDPDPAYLELSAPIKRRLAHSEQAEAMRFARDLHHACCDRISRGAVR